MRDTKKSAKADLESKKTMFIEIGLVVALAAVLFAFEWKSYEKIELSLASRVVDDTPEESVESSEFRLSVCDLEEESCSTIVRAGPSVFNELALINLVNAPENLLECEISD